MNALALLRLFITFWPIIRKYGPLLKKVLPVVLKLVERYEGTLQEMLDRPGTDTADDFKDFTKEVTKKQKWDPFKKYWEE